MDRRSDEPRFLVALEDEILTLTAMIESLQRQLEEQATLTARLVEALDNLAGVVETGGK
jgi:uncharacterized protein with PhoU and TrkA domain